MSRILVIEDDDIFRHTVIATLEKHGYEVFEAPGGAKGVQLARDLRPDLVLCDVNMDGADGRLTLFALRRDPQLASTPFVLMSGQTLSGEALPGTGRGADAFLRKPFLGEKLLTTIENCLNQAGPPPDAVEQMTNGGDVCWVSEALLQSLEETVEAVRRVLASDPQAANLEIMQQAALVRQSALRLKQLIEQHEAFKKPD